MTRRVTRRSTDHAPEEQYLQYAHPWMLWLAMLPASLITRLLYVQGRQDPAPGQPAEGGSLFVPLGVLVVTAALALWARHITSDRSRTGRVYQIVNIVTAGLWITTVSWRGFTIAALQVWFIVGVGLCLAHNIRSSKHTSTTEKLFPDTKATKEGPSLAAWFQALVSRMPAIAAPAERPAIAAPAAPAGVEAVDPASAKTVAKGQAKPVDPADDPKAQREAQRVVETFGRNFARLQVAEPKYAKTRLIWNDLTAWRASGTLRLPALDDQLASALTNERERFAKLNRIGLDRILMRINPADAADVFFSLIIMDTLAEPRDWAPPEIGGSAGERPVRVGWYEDGKPEELMQPPVWDIQWSGTGSNRKITKLALKHNLTHLGIEGAPGAGKSNCARIIAAQHVVMDDAEFWAVDCSKGAQTLGPIAPGLEWVIQDVKQARRTVTWWAESVIKTRASYLASPHNALGRPLDGWVPGCGLPFLWILFEEAGMIANELGDLYKLFNLARSAGVALILSLQRAHSAVVDTNVRSALGSIMSYGFKSNDDAFLIDDEMIAAGASPGQWKANHPGKHYLAQPGLSMERQLMVARTERIDEDLMRAFVTEQAPRHRALLRERHPHWYMLLEKIDTRGLYAQRKTGSDMLDELNRGMADFIPLAADLSKAAAPDATREVEPMPRSSDVFGGEDDLDLADLERQLDDLDGDLDLDDDFATPPSEGDDDRDEGQDPLDILEEALREGGLSPSERATALEVTRDAMEDPSSLEDPGDEFDAGVPAPADALSFERPDRDVGLPPEQARAYILQWLAHQYAKNGGEFEFTGPAVLHRELGSAMGPVGHGPAWYRSFVRELVHTGVCHQDRKGEPYHVLPKIREVAPVTAEPVGAGGPDHPPNGHAP